MRTIEFFRLKFWVLENPTGRMERLTGLPPSRMSFDPARFGAPIETGLELVLAVGPGGEVLVHGRGAARCMKSSTAGINSTPAIFRAATKPLLDLVQLRDLLGPDHSTMHDDLVPKLK